MRDSSYWKQFESTGKIEDYLNYKTNSVGGQRTSSYAGSDKRDRNDSETDTGGGVRQEDYHTF